MAKVLIAPNGAPIVGTLELIPGVAGIQRVKAGKGDGGLFEIEYDGETEVDWDNQVTVKRKGGRVFVDPDGQEWLESQLRLIDEDVFDEIEKIKRDLAKAAEGERLAADRERLEIRLAELHAIVAPTEENANA